MKLILSFAAAAAAFTINQALSSFKFEDGGFAVVDPQDWTISGGISNCESGLCLLDKSSAQLQAGKIYVDIDYSGTFYDRTLASYKSPRGVEDGYDYNYDYDMYLKDYGDKKAYDGINVHVPNDANLDALNRTITRLDLTHASSWLSKDQMIVTIDCTTLRSADKTIRKSLSKIHQVLVTDFDNQPISSLLELDNILWIAPDQLTAEKISDATSSNQILIQTVIPIDEGNFSTNVGICPSQ